MRVLSASEAVAPAFKRTKEIIFQRFRLGRSWKLAAIAVVAGFAAMYLPSLPLQNGTATLPPNAPQITKTLIAGMNSFTKLFVVAMDIIALVLFYLGARMQFVLLETIATHQTAIAPLWRKYGDKTWRWIGVKIIPSAIFIVPFTLLSIINAHSMNHLQRQLQPGQPPPPQFFVHIFVFSAVLFIAIGVVMLFSSLLCDFALPPMALENASISLAWKRFGQFVKLYPADVFFYAFLKAVLFFVSFIAAYVTGLLALGVPALLCALALALVYHLAGHILGILVGVVGVGAMIFYAIYFYFLIAGTMITFFQAYGMYFYGGRYQPLGDALEPPTPAILPTYELPLPESSL